MIFQAIGTIIAKKPFIFVIFQGGGGVGFRTNNARQITTKPTTTLTIVTQSRISTIEFFPCDQNRTLQAKTINTDRAEVLESPLGVVLYT